MSKFKFSTGGFLEKIELNRLSKFLDIDGFRKHLLDNTDTFGLIKKDNAEFVNGQVKEDVSLTIKMNALEAIDSNGNSIMQNEVTQIVVPADSLFYWVKVSHTFSPKEKGTYTIDGSGNLVCTSGDGELLSILRGQPNFPSRIKFLNAINNTLEFDVLEVIDNNNAILSGYFVTETNLTLAVVGTFAPGTNPPSQDKQIFQYDSCTLSLVQEGTLTNPPTPPSKTAGIEFFLARVQNNGVSILIEDKRNELWKTNANFFLHDLDRNINNVIGIEKVTFDDPLSTKDKNLVYFAWAMRSTSYSINPKLNKITISDGEGGKIKLGSITSTFTNGEFDNWRLYTKSGKYFKIITSVVQGSSIELILENLEYDEFSTDLSQQILICPNSDEIELVFTPINTSGNNIVQERVFYPINTPFIKERLSAFDKISSNCVYTIQYRYKHIRDYSGLLNLSSDTIGYYNENQFDVNGNLILAPTRTPLTGSQISLITHPNSYSNFQTNIITGDLIGVNETSISAATLINLEVGVSKQYQHFSGSSINITGDTFINLKSGLKDGNFFILHFNQVISTLNANVKLRIVQDYIAAPLSYVTLKEFIGSEFAYLINQGANKANQGIYIRCTWNGSNWILNNINEDGVRVGSIIMFDGTVSGNFDTSGLGTNEWGGYALCNGNNGTPNLSGKFIAGYAGVVGDYDAIGNLGGEDSVTLTGAQSGTSAHNHGVLDNGHVHGSTTFRHGVGAGAAVEALTHGDYGGGTSGGVSIQPSTTGIYVQNSTEAPATIAHENRPSYFVLAYVKKIS